MSVEPPVENTMTAAAWPGQPSRRQSLGRLLPLGDPFALAGFAIYAVFVLVAIFADRLATHDPTQIFYDANFNLAADLPPGGTRPGPHPVRGLHQISSAP